VTEFQATVSQGSSYLFFFFTSGELCAPIPNV